MGTTKDRICIGDSNITRKEIAGHDDDDDDDGIEKNICIHRIKKMNGKELEEIYNQLNTN